MIINGVSYKLSGRNIGGKNRYHIETTKCNPQSLSKYYSLNDQNVEALRRFQVYLNTPQQFNDLFDSLFHQIDLSQIDKVDLTESIDYFIRDEEYRVELKNKLNDSPREAAVGITNMFTQIFVQDYGILCTTENQENDLMWAHYANNNGYLVEYDFKNFPSHFGNPIEINYIESFPPFEPRNMVEYLNCALTCSLLKKSLWSYENEHRFLVIPPSDRSFETPDSRLAPEELQFIEPRLQTISKSAIKKVVFGFKLFDEVTRVENIPLTELEFELDGEKGQTIKKLVKFIHENAIPVEWLSIETTNLALVRRPIAITPIDDYRRIRINYLDT